MGRRALAPPPGGWEKATRSSVSSRRSPSIRNFSDRRSWGGSTSVLPQWPAKPGATRDYISHPGCRFPDLYQAIKALQEPSVEPRSLAEVNLRLRQRNRELLEAVKTARAKVAAALLRMDQTAKDYDRKRNELERIQKRQGADPNRVAGRSRDHGKVLELPAPSIEG